MPSRLGIAKAAEQGFLPHWPWQVRAWRGAAGSAGAAGCLAPEEEGDTQTKGGRPHEDQSDGHGHGNEDPDGHQRDQNQAYGRFAQPDGDH
jgi:hypothetical protein